jgi:hypothetical protein
MRCFLEINTGTGEYVQVVDFGYYTTQMQSLLSLIGNPNLLNDLNGVGADRVASNIIGTIDQLRTQVNNVANAQQQLEYDRLIRYLSAIHAAGLVHPACNFRSVAPNLPNIQFAA